MGTAAAGNYNGDFGQVEVIRDWGWRSTHEMTVAAKTIVGAYYGRAPETSYFNGCSTGGHQGLSEAQRFPTDYDGIIAGAAGNYRIGLHVQFLYVTRLAADTPGALFSTQQAQAVNRAVLARCADKNAGLPAGDYVANPLSCDFKPESMVCQPGQDPAVCLTPTQAIALSAAYAGLRHSRTGKIVEPGFAVGAELAIQSLMARELSAEGAWLTNWSKGAAFDPRKFDFGDDLDELYSMWGADIEATNPDLIAFAARGGKLISYHGWNDVIVSPYDSIRYHEASDRRSTFSRLFMIPGMDHCGGGVGLTALMIASKPIRAAISWRLSTAGPPRAWRQSKSSPPDMRTRLLPRHGPRRHLRPLLMLRINPTSSSSDHSAPIRRWPGT